VSLYCDSCRKFENELPRTFDTFVVDEYGWSMCQPCADAFDRRCAAAYDNRVVRSGQQGGTPVGASPDVSEQTSGQASKHHSSLGAKGASETEGRK
jgi:hypothetical protein